MELRTILPSDAADAGPPHKSKKDGRGIELYGFTTQVDYEAEVARMCRVWTFGALIWGSSGVLDWLTASVVGEGRLWYFLLLRGIELAVVIAGAVRMSMKPVPGPRELLAIDLGGPTLACVMVALMCLDYRGLASPYAHGVSCILVARGITLAHEWRRGLLRIGLPAVAFPVTLVAATMVLPDKAPQLSHPQSLAIFAQNLIWIFSTVGLLVIGGHIVWSLRRQIVEARSVGRYKLKRRIGAGGMGEVWEAYYPALRHNVAIKILKPDLAQDKDLVARFEREVRVTTSLKHPNTVRVFDYGMTPDGLWYCAMELLEGETLTCLVEREGPLAPRRALHIGAQAAKALSEAHAKNVIHRDIKPENLFVTAVEGERDFVKVLDFGIAKFCVADQRTDLTQEGTVLGTPLFMSPEQIKGDPVDASCDIYSLGAVLYFMLTGRPPFLGGLQTHSWVHIGMI